MIYIFIGIGIDDMFVIVSSWRLTSYGLSVEERMGKTMENAAISITVTSMTDALAFGIGSLTTFPAVCSLIQNIFIHFNLLILNVLYMIYFYFR
jgi:hypothetical protein